MIIIDTSVWIHILNKSDHPKAQAGRDLIIGSDDIGIPGIILEEILRGIRQDRMVQKVKTYLLEDYEYLKTTQETYIKAAEIYRYLRRKGITLKNSADCLIAAIAMRYHAVLVENDLDFSHIATHFPLHLY